MTYSRGRFLSVEGRAAVSIAIVVVVVTVDVIAMVVTHLG